jgi:HEAT repeat protein
MTANPKSGMPKPRAVALKKALAQVVELVAALHSRNPVAREKAREALVALGEPAVPSLIQLLSDRKSHVRWEAAKALGRIADPIAASALVNALEDRDGDVRWLAAEGLAALGRDALPPLLAALMERHQSDQFCEGAHRVCRVLIEQRELGQLLRPLLDALTQSEPQVTAPLAAYTALAQLREVPPRAAASIGSRQRK